MQARLDPRAPFVLDVHELGRRPGTMQRFARSVPAPPDLGLDVIGVPEGAVLDLEGRLESVSDGVLVTVTVRTTVTGECARCLDPIDRPLEVDVQELYVYDPAEARVAGEEDVPALEGDLIDLEPAVRDAVVLALPVAPLCRIDCPGLCPQCGAHLADDPGHAHEDVDPRWSALQVLVGDTPPARTESDDPSRTSAPTRRRASRGRPEEEDLAQQHAPPPFELEGVGAVAGRLRPLRREEAAARRMPELRHLQQAPGPRGLSGATPA